MQEILYFGAGPAALPGPVLEKIQQEFLNYQGTGLSVVELPHRGQAFLEIREDAEALLRELLQIQDDYAVLFMHGGATSQFSMLPLNFLGPGPVRRLCVYRVLVLESQRRGQTAG